MNNIELSKKAERIAKIIAAKKNPLTADQKARVGAFYEKLRAAALEPEVDEEQKDDPKIRQIILEMRAYIPIYNKFKNRKVKQLVPGINGNELINMKLIDLLDILAGVGRK